MIPPHNDYEKGRQPCDKFTPEIWACSVRPVEHECMFCRGRPVGEGTVSFCNNCNRDHHSEGYETCLRVGLPVGCRRCTECEGEEHHWIEAFDKDGNQVCKHCPATRSAEEYLAEYDLLDEELEP